MRRLSFGFLGFSKDIDELLCGEVDAGFIDNGSMVTLDFDDFERISSDLTPTEEGVWEDANWLIGSAEEYEATAKTSGFALVAFLFLGSGEVGRADITQFSWQRVDGAIESCGGFARKSLEELARFGLEVEAAAAPVGIKQVGKMGVEAIEELEELSAQAVSAWEAFWVVGAIGIEHGD